jgi:hypothetical protein
MADLEPITTTPSLESSTPTPNPEAISPNPRKPTVVQIVEQPASSSQKILFFLKALEYLSIAIFIGFGVISIVSPGNPTFSLWVAISLSLAIFFFFLNKLVLKLSTQNDTKQELKKKAALYLINSSSDGSLDSIVAAREKVLVYSQELIDDYKNIRTQARTIYYILQLTTIVFSGVTPILVLADKLESNQSWLKWLPVICPAIASIVASVVTSFPFQKNWVNANRAVELIEAEQEKFILGVTQAYRCYDSVDENDQQQKANQAIENFITHVNNIHLKQLQAPESNEAQKKEEKPQSEQSANADSSPKANSGDS